MLLKSKSLGCTIGATPYPPTAESFQTKGENQKVKLPKGWSCAEEWMGFGKAHLEILILDTGANPMETPAFLSWSK